MIEDRFQIVDSQSVKLPGKCLICGYGEDGRAYIDLGVQVKRYGRLYFCLTCFRECEKIVNAAIGNPASGGIPEFRSDLLDDGPKPEPAKKPVGRPKGSGTRATKPNPKQGSTRVRDNAG